MADTCEVYTVAGMTINHASDDTLITEEIDGLDGVDLRRTIPPQGAADGAILLTSRKAHRIVTFSGYVAIRSVEWDDDFGASYRAAQETLCDAWISALAGIENASSTLTWGTKDLTVYKNGGPKFSGPPFGKKFIFSLFAPNPTIT